MDDVQIVLVKEGLKLADDALGLLMQVENQNVRHIANLLHAAISFGEMLTGSLPEEKQNGES